MATLTIIENDVNQLINYVFGYFPMWEIGGQGSNIIRYFLVIAHQQEAPLIM
jgi:hypothetical protein